jgi:DNA polymerase-3 subunit epsilon
VFEWFKTLHPSYVELPVQWQKVAWRDLPLLAIDLELTSLDPRLSKIVSIGWVASVMSQIQLESCFYEIVRTESSLNQSPVIHGLVEHDIANGKSLEQVLMQLADLAESHIWVFHNSALDMSVLSSSFREYGIEVPKIVLLDTLQLSLYQLHKVSSVIPTNGATLASCRQRFQLPLAPAHNALDDAFATLELAFPLLIQLDASGETYLSEFSHTGAIKLITDLNVSKL